MKNNTNLTGFPYDITITKLDDQMAISTLRINVSRHEDAGHYNCIMSNNYRQASSRAVNVTILGIVIIIRRKLLF